MSVFEVEESTPPVPRDVEIEIGMGGNGGVVDGGNDDDDGIGGDDDATPSTPAAAATAAASAVVLARPRSFRLPPSLRMPSPRMPLRRLSSLPFPSSDDSHGNGNGRRRGHGDGDSIGTIHLSDLGGSGGDEFDDDDNTIVEDEAWLRDSIRRIRESRLVAANKDMGEKFIRTRVKAVAVLIGFLVVVAVLLAVLNGRGVGATGDDVEAIQPVVDPGNLTDAGQTQP